MGLQPRLPRRTIMIHHDHLDPQPTLHVQRRNLFIAKVLEQNA